MYLLEKLGGMWKGLSSSSSGICPSPELLASVLTASLLKLLYICLIMFHLICLGLIS